MKKKGGKKYRHKPSEGGDEVSFQVMELRGCSHNVHTSEEASDSTRH